LDDALDDALEVAAEVSSVDLVAYNPGYGRIDRTRASSARVTAAQGSRGKGDAKMPGFHWWELLPLLLIGILIFGPKKLPELGSSVGKTIKEFQKSMREVTDKPEETPAQPPQVTTSPRPELSAPAATATTTPTAQAPTPQQPPV
jgi:sec-independent protein translocase protein TatA